MHRAYRVHRVHPHPPLVRVPEVEVEEHRGPGGITNWIAMLIPIGDRQWRAWSA